MKKNVTLQIGLVQSAYWVGFSAFYSFSSVYLLSVGLSTSMVGIVLAVGAFLSALLQPVVGNWIDKFEKITIRKALMVMGALTALIPCLILLLKPTNIAVIAVLYSFGVLMVMLAQPFTNAFAIAAVNANYGLNVGLARSSGSLTYAIAAYLIGIFSVSIGANVVLAVALVAFSILMAAAFFCPVRELSTKNESMEGRKTGALQFLTKYKYFAFMLLGMVFIYFGHAILNCFHLQILIPKGGTSANVGTAAAISAVSEIVVMSSFTVISKKFKLSTLIKLSGVFYTLKIIGSLLVPNVIGYYFVQVFQMLAFAVMAMAIIFYVNELVDAQDRAKGQAYAGVALTIGNVIGSFFGGTLIDSVGINITLIIAAIVSFVGAVILWVNTKDVSKKKTCI